ncbi:alpha/beta fold hydrolase [Pseudomonas fluorescens]|uniref:Alpha/beta hydrolase n=1 Tax=Pseudomonas fluorescens TaxID=294 RepID=A0A5E6ZZF8_PSEFL|nr:alpha/beta hydrolase [Pseudomonas fluorescens]VVN71259.1 hypothetical protein PS723_00419 [Pseudomonas fluorescens]
MCPQGQSQGVGRLFIIHTEGRPTTERLGQHLLQRGDGGVIRLIAQTQQIARLAADIPGATLHIIEEAGHFLMEDAPDAVVGYVAEFALAHRADT